MSRNAVSGEHLVDQLHLLLIRWCCGPALPETLLCQHSIHRELCLGDSPMQRIEKPRQPIGHVEGGFLGTLKDVLVGLAFALNLR